MEPLQIDGSHGEGGGQILRTSLSLSVLTGQPVEIVHIRAGRSKPGLKAQHLAAVQAAAAISAAQVEGAELGSQRLRFTPLCAAAPGEYHFAIGTAGAATLVAQTVLLPLALASGPSRVTIVGGTHVPFAPTAEYLEHVYLAGLRRRGLQVSLAMPTAGFFPRGGGKIILDIQPSALSPALIIERGMLHSITAHIAVSGLPPTVGERGAEAIRESLGKFKGILTTEIRDLPSPGQGGAVTLVAECESSPVGFSAIGERGKRIETVAAEACAAFEAWNASGATCDEHLADQLVLPFALTAGESRWSTSQVTDHLRSVLWLLPQFLPIKVNLLEHTARIGSVSLISHGLSEKQRDSG
jgi:RNA 3'-terminal phosphate cyclase (ATP)